jgi:hypothetical protein
MDKLFDNYAKLYNLKYKTNFKFQGNLEVYLQSDNTYYVSGNLIVKDYFDKIIYDFSKDFNINHKTESIFFNKYELIGIYNDIITNKIALY